MVLGTLKVVARQVHLGVLKKYGFENILLDVDGDKGALTHIDIVSEAMLNDPDIQACLNGGILELVEAGSMDHVEDTQDAHVELPTQEPEPQETHVEPEQHVEAPSEDLHLEETVAAPIVEETPLETPTANENPVEEPKVEEAPIQPVVAAVDDNTEASEEEPVEDFHLAQDTLDEFNLIDSLKSAEAKLMISELTSVELVSALSKSAKLAGVQTAAKAKLKELLG